MLYGKAGSAWMEMGSPSGVTSLTSSSNYDPFPLEVEAVVNDYSSIRLHLDPADLASPKGSYLDELEGWNALRDHAALAEEGFQTNKGQFFGI